MTLGHRNTTQIQGGSVSWQRLLSFYQSGMVYSSGYTNVSTSHSLFGYNPICKVGRSRLCGDSCRVMSLGSPTGSVEFTNSQPTCVCRWIINLIQATSISVAFNFSFLGEGLDSLTVNSCKGIVLADDEAMNCSDRQLLVQFSNVNTVLSNTSQWYSSSIIEIAFNAGQCETDSRFSFRWSAQTGRLDGTLPPGESSFMLQ